MIWAKLKTMCGCERTMKLSNERPPPQIIVPLHDIVSMSTIASTGESEKLKQLTRRFVLYGGKFDAWEYRETP